MIAEWGIDDSKPWPMFRHDPQHTGRSPFAAPLVPSLKSTSAVGLLVNSSPAISEGDKILFALSNGETFTITPEDIENGYNGRLAGANSSAALNSDGNLDALSTGNTLRASGLDISWIAHLKDNFTPSVRVARGSAVLRRATRFFRPQPSVRTAPYILDRMTATSMPSTRMAHWLGNSPTEVTFGRLRL